MGLPPRSKAHLHTLHRGVRATQECVEQARLDAFLLPDGHPLKTHTLLRLGSSLISGGVDNFAATEVSNVLHEIVTSIQ